MNSTTKDEENKYFTYIEMLKQSRLVRDLSESEIILVCAESGAWIQNFKKGTRLWAQGDFVPYIDILIKGTFISQKYHLDGRIQLIGSFAPYEIVNLEAPVSFKGTSPVFIFASSDCSILRLNYKQLITNSSIPERIRLQISKNIAACLADDSIRFMYKSDVLSRRKVRDRVITFLTILKLQRKGNSVDIGMNQEEFAQYLCVDRTSLSEALNELRREGLIDFKKSNFEIKFPTSDKIQY